MSLDTLRSKVNRLVLRRACFAGAVGVKVSDLMRKRSLSALRGPAFVLALMCLAFAPRCLAQGGPPMLTDDPGTPGSGNWEINSALLEDRTDDARYRSVPHIDLNYGLGEHIQLKYETGFLIADFASVPGSRTGLDDSLLGVKWRFLDQDRAGSDVSIYPQLEIENSHGAVNRGVAVRGTNLFLPAEISHSFGAVSVDGEIGYQYLSTQPNQWVVGLLGAFQVSKSLELLTEIRSSSETFLSRGDLVLNLGLRQQLAPRLQLLISAGTGLRDGPDTTRFVGYLGFQWLSGESK
jgi:hypothetical protein